MCVCFFCLIVSLDLRSTLLCVFVFISGQSNTLNILPIFIQFSWVLGLLGSLNTLKLFRLFKNVTQSSSIIRRFLVKIYPNGCSRIDLNN